MILFYWRRGEMISLMCCLKKWQNSLWHAPRSEKINVQFAFFTSAFARSPIKSQLLADVEKIKKPNILHHWLWRCSNQHFATISSPQLEMIRITLILTELCVPFFFIQPHLCLPAFVHVGNGWTKTLGTSCSPPPQSNRPLCCNSIRKSWIEGEKQTLLRQVSLYSVT